ncbi:MAG: adenosylcobinamide-phosphate synthase CbiB [Agathobaculum sp.]|uniref:adenosylcobinamide-phosphate synthase CbiB n=1 Tax=Agathobaculum sp. TaxID=2048138 RepID=UPI0025B90C9F|nr:adenosylcobinamide-phosphate synthase CbiB [Agathobaculum sp.]MCI7125073.1 adenosylcobinamide-phosphate synthase CbiB [Agathobaculum sp.]
MYLTCAVLLGFALDWLLGDPQGLWHPVCAIGRLISLGEKLLRRVFPKTPRGETAAGALLWVTVCAVSFAVPFALLRWLRGINLWLGFAAETLMCWQIFARRSLADAGAQVRGALGRSLEEGRAAVAMYVGRDTGEMDAQQVIKAAVETVAENTTDGVVAPMVYLLLGGAPLGWLYKAVNTLDSMVGYHSERYEYFGKASARMDDLFNLLPARLAAVCLIAGAGMLGLDNRNALRVFRRDRARHKSPNAGQTESACAGALHVQLGGDASYFGKTVKKAAFGDPDRPVSQGDIGRAVDLMTAASVLALALCCAVRLILTF